MKLSRTVEYAVQASLALAEIGGEEPVPCSRLAAMGKMPERFLLQILRTLVTHDILRSTRGVEGGYRLSRPSTKISLLQVIEAVEGPMMGGLTAESDVVGPHSGQLDAAVDRITAGIRRELDDISLASLLDEKNSGRPSAR
jgi:Rrf2 family protein